MGYVIGIDVGGSTTKTVVFDKKTLISPICVKAADAQTSAYGAFGKIISENSLKLSDVDQIYVTGVGSDYLANDVYGIPCKHLVEFDCVGRGGLYLSELDEALVISMGTGTALIYSKKDGDSVRTEYLGGTGIGGGTLIGLSKKILGMDTVEHISNLAKTGNLDFVDLTVKDITKSETLLTLPPEMTASNFGKVSDVATQGDFALAIFNMVFEAIGMIAFFASKNKNVKDIVLTGNLSGIEHAERIFKNLGDMFGLNFVIPQHSQYATAIGAAIYR